MKLFVGLGNPDKKYQRTYHNIGFRAIEKLAKKLDASFLKKMCDGVVAETRYNDEKIWLLKPLTYMNLSGISVRQMQNKFKIADEDIIVFVDDIDLPLGKIRFREKGSAGTHNGLKSIVNEISSHNFKRIKFGIAGNEKIYDLADFVLSEISDKNIKIIDEEINQAIDFVFDKILTKNQ